MGSTVTHIVQIDRHRKFASSTLAPPVVAQLEAAYHASPWWRDRWTNRQFREAAREVLHRSGSLVLLGPRIRFDVPPAFTEFFEPIEVALALSDHTERLKTISGEKPTRQERWRWLVLAIFCVSAAAFLIPLGIAFLRGMPPRAMLFISATAIITVLVVAAAIKLRRLHGRWYLVPGAIAVVRRPVRRDLPARVTVLSREDSVLAFRYVSTGKTTVLFAELWTHLGKRIRRPVSQREAISILAAWQSPLPPPPDERLQELAW